MSLTAWIYTVSILSKVSMLVFLLSIVVLGVVCAIHLLNYELSCGQKEGFYLNKSKIEIPNYINWLIIIFIFLNILIPKRDELYLMLGTSKIEELVRKDESSEILNQSKKVLLLKLQEIENEVVKFNVIDKSNGGK